MKIDEKMKQWAKDKYDITEESPCTAQVVFFRTLVLCGAVIELEESILELKTKIAILEKNAKAKASKR